MNGTVAQTGEQGANIGRLAVMLADFPITVPAVTLNRMRLQSEPLAALRAPIPAFLDLPAG